MAFHQLLSATKRNWGTRLTDWPGFSYEHFRLFLGAAQLHVGLSCLFSLSRLSFLSFWSLYCVTVY
jgi:hypothetical protein